MNDKTRVRLTKTGFFLGGVVVGAGIIGLVFILAMTLFSHASPAILNPTEWSVAVPIIAVVVGALITALAVRIIKSHYPLAAVVYGVIFSTLIFCILVVVYYFVYAL